MTIYSDIITHNDGIIIIGLESITIIGLEDNEVKELRKHFQEFKNRKAQTETSNKSLVEHDINIIEESLLVQETVQSTDIEPETSQKQTANLEEETQKDNMAINEEALSSKEGDLEDLTENMFVEEINTDL
ncbi:2730_t:CDS:2 [Cetraspora pellucida]|uniref:2730_t:CDS:1 n=1 Tax=Cetraspora pellucida TaxID=1433469 RepID=A0A9N8ZI27_9GLOM|nr:2730_t:CDS:2 [Cetraspora pellucida]